MFALVASPKQGVHEHLQQLEIEWWAQEVRGLATLTDDDLLTGPEIAVRVVGSDNVKLSRASVGARLEGRTIIVPHDHQDISHAFAHELGELILHDRANFTGSHIAKENAANAIAAAILAPPATVLRAARHFDRQVTVIAKAFGLSHTATHLRLLEVLVEEGAVITKHHKHVMARNPEQVEWDKLVPTLSGRPKVRLGLVKTMLRGKAFERGRIAISIAK